ncbi:MAG: hypothetical protein WKF73_00710 [Nocardioidaceae bacterium]
MHGRVGFAGVVGEPDLELQTVRCVDIEHTAAPPSTPSSVLMAGVYCLGVSG